jgi:hypothetical protein
VNEVGEHVACMMDRTDAYRFLFWKPKGKIHLENTGTNGQITQTWIFKKYDVVSG